MKALTLASIAGAAVAAVAAFGAIATAANSTPASRSTLDATAAAQLESLRAAPESAGELIYRGTVAPLRAPNETPLFSYERRVAKTADGWAAAHITQDREGNVIINEQARFTPDYALQRFDAINSQLGLSGTVELSDGGRHLEYRLIDNGKTSSASEDVDAPVVSGPSLHGFIKRHWDALASGETMPVRMIVLAKKTTYGFEIRRASHAEGRTSFSITPSSWFVRLAVAPLSVTFDSTLRTVQRYEGRVPPMRDADGKLEPLDARVDYTMNVPAYR